MRPNTVKTKCVAMCSTEACKALASNGACIAQPTYSTCDSALLQQPKHANEKQTKQMQTFGFGIFMILSLRRFSAKKVIAERSQNPNQICVLAMKANIRAPFTLWASGVSFLAIKVPVPSMLLFLLFLLLWFFLLLRLLLLLLLLLLSLSWSSPSSGPGFPGSGRSGSGPAFRVRTVPGVPDLGPGVPDHVNASRFHSRFCAIIGRCRFSWQQEQLMMLRRIDQSQAIF